MSGVALASGRASQNSAYHRRDSAAPYLLTLQDRSSVTKQCNPVLVRERAGPAAWYSLPEHIRAEPDIRVFRKLLKTHLFNLAFNVH